MNISFHYFTVKTLCNYADLTPERSQEIAFYSQLVDDFNHTWLDWDCYISLTGNKPPDFFLKNNLARPSKIENVWDFYPATTGITMLQSVSQAHQYYTLIPFHFITPIPVRSILTNKPAEWRCKPAGVTNNTLMDKIMNGFINSREFNDMKLGMLLHVYADTYAHQMFSGRRGVENYATQISVIDLSIHRPLEVNAGAYYLPGIGHAELEHIPDAFALSFEADFDYDKFGNQQTYRYSRYNMYTFMDCAFKILCILRKYNNQTPMDKNVFRRDIEPLLKKAANQCVSGKSEIMDAKELAKIWKEQFPEIDYSYDCKNWGLKEINTDRKVLGKIYQPTDEFYKYNQLAYEHIFKVHGRYRAETQEMEESNDEL